MEGAVVVEVLGFALGGVEGAIDGLAFSEGSLADFFGGALFSGAVFSSFGADVDGARAGSPPPRTTTTAIAPAAITPRAAAMNTPVPRPRGGEGCTNVCRSEGVDSTRTMGVARVTGRSGAAAGSSGLAIGGAA